MELQTLKGFRDFLPEEAKKREYIVNIIKDTLETFGFEPLETPSLEYQELLMGKYGEEADKLIYKFEDQGGRGVALRYDQTVPLARVVGQLRNNLPMPFKRYQIQPVWRAEKPQKGRFREFVQVDADIVGTKSPQSDAEMLAVYYAIYENLGIGDKLTIKVNDRAELLRTVESFGVGGDRVYTIIQTLDKLDKKSPKEVVEELKAKNMSEEDANNLLDQLEGSSMPEPLKDIIASAVKMGVPEENLSYSPTLARGLDYYTGLIFEGVIEGYDAGSVGGGGRYDNLINDLVGVDFPAVGFGLGFDRTVEAAEELGVMPEFLATSQALVTVFDEDLRDNSLKLLKVLRKAGISAEIYLEKDTDIGKQLKYADRKNIPFAVIIGPEEAEMESVTLKNMETGEQEKVPQEELPEFFLQE